MTTKNICKEVPNDFTRFSSLVLKGKVAFNLTVSLFKKYPYTNSSQKALLINSPFGKYYIYNL